MRSVVLFVEDVGHEMVLQALVQRIANDLTCEIDMQLRSVRGGVGKMTSELRQYLRDVRSFREKQPDLLIIGRDANCKGYNERRREIEQIIGTFGTPVVYAIPDPHIERWLLLDSSAFKAVLGRGCAAPDQKCERDRYKRLLLDAVRHAGVTPLLGGIEHSKALVQAMDLPYLETADAALGRFIKEIRDALKQLISLP